MIYQFIYSSRVIPGVNASDLMQINDTSNMRNADHNITGMMLVSGDRIVQVLEGPREDVETLFEHIQRDLRHIEITILVEAEAESREFDGQSMVLKFVQSGSAREAFDTLVASADARYANAA